MPSKYRPRDKQIGRDRLSEAYNFGASSNSGGMLLLDRLDDACVVAVAAALKSRRWYRRRERETFRRATVASRVRVAFVSRYNYKKLCEALERRTDRTVAAMTRDALQRDRNMLLETVNIYDERSFQGIG
jgi:hypothetical protein